MDKIAANLARVGVPILVFMVAVEATGLVGAAAITAALSAIGPGGMIGGVVSLLVLGSVAGAIGEYGFDPVFKAVVKELYERGETQESIRGKIEKYPVSSRLKVKLNHTLDKLDDQVGDESVE